MLETHWFKCNVL